MPNLQKIIEENEKNYRKWLIRNISPYLPKDRRTTIVESAISALDTTQFRLIEGFREMVREKQTDSGDDFKTVNLLGKSDIIAVLDIMSEGDYTKEEAETEIHRIQMKNISHLIEEFKNSLISELGDINEIK